MPVHVIVRRDNLVHMYVEHTVWSRSWNKMSRCQPFSKRFPSDWIINQFVQRITPRFYNNRYASIWDVNRSFTVESRSSHRILNHVLHSSLIFLHSAIHICDRHVRRPMMHFVEATFINMYLLGLVSDFLINNLLMIAFIRLTYLISTNVNDPTTYVL